MAKAKKRIKPDPVREAWEGFATQHTREHDADYLLDKLESNAKRILSDHPNDEAFNNARTVLYYVKQARAGNMAAAIQAERHNWRAEWHARGTTDALVCAAEYVVKWRGKVVDCGNRKQHKRMLEAIGDNDRLDLNSFMQDAGFDSITSLRKAFSELNQRLPGYRFSVRDKHEEVTVKIIT